MRGSASLTQMMTSWSTSETYIVSC